MEITKAEVLNEFPLKRRTVTIEEEGGGKSIHDEVTTWEEFKDLQRIIKSQVMSQRDLEFFKREVIARRDEMGLVAGVNKRKLVDGQFRYVSANQ